jgi:hypothetical protein
MEFYLQFYGQLIKFYEFPESFIKMWNFIKGVNSPIKKRKTEDKPPHLYKFDNIERRKIQKRLEKS